MYNFSNIAKKQEYTLLIERILDAVKSIDEVKQGREGQEIRLEIDTKRMCFALFSGTCIVKRANDSLILSTIQAPAIIGLQDLLQAKPGVYIHSLDDVKYGLVEVDELFSYAEDKNLWKDICYILMVCSTRFSEYQLETVGISNHDLICNLLSALSRETFEIRATTTILEYIQGRSLLSRNSITKTLSFLKQEGYITIKRGILISINSLPKEG